MYYTFEANKALLGGLQIANTYGIVKFTNDW